MNKGRTGSAMLEITGEFFIFSRSFFITGMFGVGFTEVLAFLTHFVLVFKLRFFHRIYHRNFWAGRKRCYCFCYCYATVLGPCLQWKIPLCEMYVTDTSCLFRSIRYINIIRSAGSESVPPSVEGKLLSKAPVWISANTQGGSKALVDRKCKYDQWTWVNKPKSGP